MKKILISFFFIFLTSTQVHAQNSQFEYVAFIQCGSSHIALSLCLIDNNNQDNNSYLDLTNFSQRTVFSFRNITKAGPNTKSGTGIKLSKNFKLTIKNVNQNVGLSVIIFSKDDQNNPVFKQIARYNQTIDISN